uniref:Polyadenylation and cleavage factor homolog 11 (Trinotate prediction) n=1 Tax=Myxobolus squamalis TaxID=59785 RepID=A0A6B2G2Y9_MYXSQ
MQSDIYHSYCRSLLELKNNSKHVIEYLTDLASKSKEHADQIVEAIVQRTFDSNKEAQLYHLYLIDSIMKKIGEPYNSLLFPMIFDLFMFSFQHASDNIRICLFKLFISWKLILPEDILTNIILTASNIDSHWPLQSFADFKDENLLKYFPQPQVPDIFNENPARNCQDMIPCNASDKRKQLHYLQDDKNKIMRNLKSLKGKRDNSAQMPRNDDIRRVKKRAHIIVEFDLFNFVRTDMKTLTTTLR